jgi:hypothetical protein
MKLYDDFAGLAVALIISTIGAIVAAGSAFLLTIFVGARLFKGELSYGIPLFFGPLVTAIAGLAVFVVIFRKIRSV